MRTKWDRSLGRPEPIAALNRVRLEENGEPLVLITELAPKTIIARPTVIPFLRESAARMLGEAASRLPQGLTFGVVDAWRPLARQQRIYDAVWAWAREAYPVRTYAQLRRTVNRWAAPTDQYAPPGHCTGGAVDVWLMTENGENVDVTSPFQRFSAAPTYSFGLTVEAQTNRMILVDSMLEAGFSNCRDEWWHYSYGDAGWAVRTGRDACIYGLAELKSVCFEEAERLHVEAMKERENPFVTGR